MEDATKCPKCSSPMKQGIVIDQGHIGSLHEQFWTDRTSLSLSARMGLIKKELKKIRSFGCTKCVYVESYIDLKE